MLGLTPLASVIVLLAVIAAVVGMMLWGTKSSSRGLVLLVAGIAVLVGFLLGTGRL